MKSAWEPFVIPNEAGYRPVRVIDYGGHGREPRQLYASVPTAGDDCPVIVWFHGGGLTGGGREVPDVFFDGMSIVAEARYRFAPDHPSPTALVDAAAAVAWVVEHAATLGGDPRAVFVGGMSAGAYLAAMVGMNPRLLQPFRHHPCDLAGLMLVSGQMSTHFQIKKDLLYAQGQFEPVIDHLAPLGHLSADLPPILLVTGESGRDLPGRPEENAYMAACLGAIGHPSARHIILEGCDHGSAFVHCGPLLADFIDEVLATRRQ